MNAPSSARARGDRSGSLAWIADHPLRLVLGAVGGALATITAVLAVAVAIAISGRVDVAGAGTAKAYVFVAPGTGERDGAALRDALAAQNGVAVVRYVARDAALATLSRRFAALGANDPLAELKSNPLPDAYVAEFRAGTGADELAAAAQAWRKMARVDSVQIDVEGYRSREALRRLAAPLLALALALAGIGWLHCLAATAGAAATLDPTEVRALRLVGADEGFIRRPALRAGAVVGALGGVLAAAALVLGVHAFGPAIRVGAASLDIDPAPLLDATPGAVAVAIAALTLATAGAAALAAGIRVGLRQRRIPGP
jgi:cell division protein FtsX